MDFVLLTDATEDVDRFWDGRFIDQNLGKSALEGSVLLNVLAIFTGSYVSNHKEWGVAYRLTLVWSLLCTATSRERAWV